MPVTRKRESVAFRGARPDTNAGQNPVPQMLRQQGQSLARLASDYGRVMAQTAADEGEALGKRAVFATGPNGLPQLPEDITGRIGSIAARAYDATVEDRYTHQLQTAIRAQIRDAENANLYSPENFQADAEGRLAALEIDLPEGYEGVFQNLVAGEMVDAGLSIGRRVAQVEEQNATSRVPVMVEDWKGRITEAVWAGDDDAARMMNEQLDFIFNAPSHVLTDGQKEAYAREIWAHTGATRMIRDLGLHESDDPMAVMNVIERLNTGRDPELMKYFADPRTGDPSFEMAQYAAGRLNQLLGQANARRSEATSRDKATANYRNIADGVASKSKETQSALDDIVANDIGIENPAAPGTRGQMTWQSWFGLSEENRHKAVARVKDAGFLPASAEQAFRRLERMRDSDEAGELFLLYRDLKEGPNSRGEVRDLTGDLPEDVQVVMELASAMHGPGDSANESLGQAFAMIDALNDQEWDDKALAQTLNRNKGFFDDYATEDNARSMLRGLVSEIYEGVDYSTREGALAETLLETYIRMNNTPDEAKEMVRQSMEGRFAETEFMLSAERSEFAPEIHYREPQAASMMAVLGKADREVGAQIAHFREFIRGVGIFDVDLGADRINATTFERMADTEIRRMLSEMDNIFDATDFDTGWSFFKPGRDYWLTPDRGSGKPPVYRVWMRDANNRPFPLEETLDLRSDWADLEAANGEVAVSDQTQYYRALEAVMFAKPGSRFEPIARDYWNLVARGDDANAKRLILTTLGDTDE